MSNLAELQKDMRQGYLWGATGIIASGLVWLAAALVAYSYSPTRAIWTLFIGAAFIHPLSIVICRVLGAPGKHSAGNGLARLAMESTVSMIMCLTLAYGLSLFRIEWFFPAVLMIIAGRYLTFATIYGTPAYWLLGALLGGAAIVGFQLSLPPYASAFLGAAIEIAFGTALLVVKRGGA